MTGKTDLASFSNFSFSRHPTNSMLNRTFEHILLHYVPPESPGKPHSVSFDVSGLRCSVRIEVSAYFGKRDLVVDVELPRVSRQFKFKIVKNDKVSISSSFFSPLLEFAR